jgi:hypothetical protein
VGRGVPRVPVRPPTRGHRGELIPAQCTPVTWPSAARSGSRRRTRPGSRRRA